MPLVVYFDEVGNPTLDASDKDFPVFGLTLFICDADQYVQKICPAVNNLKFKWFAHESVVLHSRDIRKAQGEFGFLTDPQKRSAFMSDLSDLMRDCEYQLIAVAIHKEQHAKRYRYPADPYDLALLFAMERLLSVLEAHRQAEVTVIAERRGKNEDRQLYLAFQRIVTRGTDYVDGTRFSKVKFTMRFIPKSMNVVGTQLADLAAYPIARRVLDSTKPNLPYDIVKKKLCRALKIFP